MQKTANYGLNKPDGTDTVDISVLNGNMDTIDVKLKNNSDDTEALGEKVSSHLADMTKHITAAERTAWNGKIDKSLFTAAGDLLYASAAGTPARLGKGTDGQALMLSGGLPEWGNISSGAKVASGTYTGDSTSTRLFSVGFIPRLFFVKDIKSNDVLYALININGVLHDFIGTGGTVATETGLYISGYGVYANSTGIAYEYTAIG